MDFLWTKVAAIKDFPPYDETRNWRKEVFSACASFLRPMLTPTFYQDSKTNAATSDFQTFAIFFFTPPDETLEENTHRLACVISWFKWKKNKNNLMWQLLYKSSSIENVSTAARQKWKFGDVIDEIFSLSTCWYFYITCITILFPTCYFSITCPRECFLC